MKTVYFDNCVYGHVADGRVPPADVEVLRESVANRKVRVAFSMANMDELARRCAANMEGGRRTIAFAREVCAGQGVRFHSKILSDEVHACLDGRRPASPFMESGSSDERELLRLWDLLASNPSTLAAELNQFSTLEETHANEFNAQMIVARREGERIRQQEGVDPTLAYSAWRRSQFEGGVCAEGWTRRALREAGRPEERWRTLVQRSDSIHAFRMYLDISFAYAYALIVESTSTRTSFAKDMLHAIYAGRMDVFVSDDTQFLRIIRYIPAAKRCAVFDWPEFVTWMRTLQ